MAVIYKKSLPKVRDDNPGVSIITPTNRTDYIDRIFANYKRQSFKNKELIIILNKDSMDLRTYKERAIPYENIRIFQIDEKYKLGECRDYGIKQARLDYIALFDDDDYYGPNYLSRSINTFSKVKADIVGKGSFFTYFEGSKTLAVFNHLNNLRNEHQYVRHVCDPTLVFKRSIMEKIKTYPSAQVNPDVLFQDLCIEYGFKIYSNDKYNFVLHRHPNPSKNHTWTVEERDILIKCKIVSEHIDDYTSYVNK